MKLPDEQILDNSEVLTDFYRIVSASMAAPNPDQEDPKTIEEKVLEVDEDLIEEAHPEPVYVAEALGDGALVENQNEQHEKMMGVVNEMPNGKLIHNYACCALDLVKLAQECSLAGETEAAELITVLAESVLDRLPFVQAPNQLG